MPGAIAGITSERVLRSPASGVYTSAHYIGVPVTTGEVVGQVGNIEVKASISGILRGQIRPGTRVAKGMKIGDIDPRGDATYCNTISDKARAVSGGVVEAVLQTFNTPIHSP